MPMVVNSKKELLSVLEENIYEKNIVLNFEDLSFLYRDILYHLDPYFEKIDLSQWDVSKVTNMQSMFENAISFNQPLNFWDVS